MSRRTLLTAGFVAAGTLLAACIALTTLQSYRPPAHPRLAAVRVEATDARRSPAVGPVVVFGDSLMHESRAYLTQQLGASISVEMHTFPLTAPCDFFDALRATATAPPRVAVLEFSGNALTPCMRAADGSFPAGRALAARYEHDATFMTDALVDAGVRVIWVDAPRGRPAILTPGQPPRTDQFSGAEPFTVRIYQHLVTRFRDAGADVRLVQASRAVLTDSGAWTPTRPCLPIEQSSGACTLGAVSVRAPDGTHFCPTGATDPNGLCPVWSGGAWRYATAIAGSISAAIVGG